MLEQLGLGIVPSAESGAVQLSSRQIGASLSISDSSGLLAALQIAPGAHQSTAGTLQPAALADPYRASGSVADAIGSLNDALAELFPGGRSASPAHTALRATLQTAFDRLGQQLGSALTFVDGRQPRIVVDGRRLETALAASGQGLEDKLAALDTLVAVLGATRPLPAPEPPASPAAPGEPGPRPPLLVNPLSPPVTPPLEYVDGPSSGANAGREPWRIDAGLTSVLDRRIDSGKAQLVESAMADLRESLREAARQQEKWESKKAEAGEPKRSWTWEEQDKEAKARAAGGPDGIGNGGGSKSQEGAARRAQGAYERARITSGEAAAPERSAPARPDSPQRLTTTRVL